MANVKHILLVDDDDDLREALAEQLVLLDAFKVSQAASGAEAFAALAGASFDLIILDIDLPDANGLDLCKKFREQKVKSPIVMLTGHDTDTDTIAGLDSGANDYVTKPFKFAVLLARLNVQLRQFEQSEDATFKFGPYRFHPAQKILLDADGKKLRLTEKETNILKFLYRAQPETVSRETLLHEVWGYNQGITTHTLETHIYRLRQKIEIAPKTAPLLVTEGGGYRLCV